jgi:hypothetical protein
MAACSRSRPSVGESVDGLGRRMRATGLRAISSPVDGVAVEAGERREPPRDRRRRQPAVLSQVPGIEIDGGSRGRHNVQFGLRASAHVVLKVTGVCTACVTGVAGQEAQGDGSYALVFRDLSHRQGPQEAVRGRLPYDQTTLTTTR